MQRALAILLTLLFSTAVRADLPCDAGGEIARSTSGRATLSIGPHGCRQFPTGELRVDTPSRSYVVTGQELGERAWLSDTGRTIVSGPEHPRAHADSVQLLRDGHFHGTYTLRELLGESHATVTQQLFVDVSVDGVDLVIRDLQGGELLRRYLGDFPHRRR